MLSIFISKALSVVLWMHKLRYLWLSHFLLLWTPHLEFTPARPSLDSARPWHLLKPNWKPYPYSISASQTENLPLTVFLPQLIPIPSFCYCQCVCVCMHAHMLAHTVSYMFEFIAVCVCVCVHVFWYNTLCFGRTVRYMHIEYHI